MKLFAGPYGPWLPFGIGVILFATAAWDARTGIVPNIPLLCGAAAVVAGRFLANGFPDAIMYLALGLGVWAIIWGFNEAWFRLFGKDAIGMGDAKWTALAAATFGIMPALLSWLAGSWLSIMWIILCFVVGKRIRKVYFAPFLFCGLIVALCFTRKLIELPYPYNFF